MKIVLRTIALRLGLAASASCVGTATDTTTTVPTPSASPSAPRPADVRVDPPLPPGAVARCGTELMMLQGTLLDMVVDDAGEPLTLERIGNRVVVREPGRAKERLSFDARAGRFSDDGKLVVVTTAEHHKIVKATVADARTGAVRFEAPFDLGKTNDRVVELAVSSNAKRVLVRGGERLLLLEAAAPPKVYPIKGRRLAAFSRNGRLAAFGDTEDPKKPQKIEVVELSSGKVLGTVTTGPYFLSRSTHYLFSADDRSLLAVRAEGLYGAPVRGGPMVEQASFPDPDDSTPHAPQASLSADGRKLLVGLRASSVMVTLPGKTVAPIATPGRDLPYSRPWVGISPSGAAMAALSGRRIVVSGGDWVPSPAHEDEMRAIAYFDSGARLASLGADGVRVWDGRTCEHLGVLRGTFHGLTAARDGKRLAVTSDAGTIVLDEALTEQLRVRASGKTTRLALNADGTRLWVGLDHPELADRRGEGLALPSGRSLHAIDLATKTVTSSALGIGIRALGVSPKATHVVVVTSDHKVHRLDGALRSSSPLLTEPAAPDGIRFVNEDRVLLHMAHNFYGAGTTLLVDATRGAVEWSRRVHDARQAEASPGGEAIAVGAERVVFFDPKDGAFQGAIGPGAGVVDMAFAPDGRLAIASRDGLMLWDPTRKDTRLVHAVVGRRERDDLSRVRDVFENEDKCAIRKDGRVHCTGDNRDGVFATIASEEPLTGTLPGIRNAIEVHTRQSTTCVLDQRGDLSCIGVLDEDHAPEPKLRRVFSGARQLALGDDHLCVVDGKGAVHCMGDNRHGELGTTTVTGSASPRAVPGLGPALRVAVGFEHSCALLEDGGVACWGATDSDQAGVNGGHPTHGPVRVAGIPPAVAIDAYEQATCTATADGEVWCWGALDGARFHRPTRIDDLDASKGLRVTGDAVCGVKAPGEVICLALKTSVAPATSP